MSSTNRSALATNPSEFYETPGPTVRAVLPFLPLDGMTLDAGAGTGAIAKVIAAASEPARVMGVELDPERCRQCRDAGIWCEETDFLSWQWPTPFRLVIGNPPFSLALEFIEKALALVEVDGGQEGTVAMLLRLNFMGGQKRSAWHRAHPSSVFVLPKRPSFTGAGTDSCEYAWFRWDPERTHEIAVLDMEGTR